jgi:hypothetical protein
VAATPGGEKLLALTLDHVGSWHQGTCEPGSLELSVRNTNKGPELFVQVSAAHAAKLWLSIRPDHLEALRGFFQAAPAVVSPG